MRKESPLSEQINSYAHTQWQILTRKDQANLKTFNMREVRDADMDDKLIEEFLEKRNIFAVVGASRDHRKYGHQIFMTLRNAGFTVYPINPNADTILGDKCYPTLESLPEKPHVADLVVPPKVTNQIVKACHKLGIKKV